MRTSVPDIWKQVVEKEQRERPWHVGGGQGRAQLIRAGGAMAGVEGEKNVRLGLVAIGVPSSSKL